MALNMELGCFAFILKPHKINDFEEELDEDAHGYGYREEKKY